MHPTWIGLLGMCCYQQVPAALPPRIPSAGAAMPHTFNAPISIGAQGEPVSTLGSVCTKSLWVLMTWVPTLSLDKSVVQRASLWKSLPSSKGLIVPHVNVHSSSSSLLSTWVMKKESNGPEIYDFISDKCYGIELKVTFTWVSYSFISYSTHCFRHFFSYWSKTHYLLNLRNIFKLY